MKIGNYTSCKLQKYNVPVVLDPVACGAGGI